MAIENVRLIRSLLRYKKRNISNMNKQSDDKASVGFFSYTCMDSFHPVLEIRIPDLTGGAKSFHHDAFLKQNNSNQ